MRHQPGAALAEQTGELLPQRPVVQEVARNPHRAAGGAGVALAGRRRIGLALIGSDESQPLELRPAAPAAPRPRHSQPTALCQGGDAGHGAGHVAGLLHGDLEHLGVHLGRELQAQGLAQPLQERAELQELEQSQDLLGARRRHGKVVDLHGQVEVASQFHQFTVEANGLLRVLQRRPQLRALFVESVVDPVYAAVAVDEPGRRLLSHPRHPWQVVRGVASQRCVGHVVGGLHAGPLLDRGRVVDIVVGDAPPRVEHGDASHRHQLEGVAIAGHDRRLQSLRLGLGGQRGQHIVRLETGSLDAADAESLQDLSQQPQLLPEDLRRGGAIGLVAVEPLVAERPARKGERNGDAFRPVVPEQVDQHRGEAVHGVGHLPGRRPHLLRERVEGPIGQRMPVDEKQAGHNRTRDGLEVAGGEAAAPRCLTAGRRSASTPPTGCPPADPRPRRASGAAGSWRCCA